MGDGNFHADAEELLTNTLRRFAGWMVEHWTMTDREAETLTQPSPAPREYARGYNDAVAQIADAFECWLEAGEA